MDATNSHITTTSEPAAAFAGGARAWARSAIVVPDTFKFYDTKNATTMRAVCSELRNVIAEYPWGGKDILSGGRFVKWRDCFPNARVAILKKHDGAGRGL